MVRSLIKLVPLSGGGNNRGFRVEGAGLPFFLKAYARRPGDKRDRLKTEFEFCSFVWGQGLRSVPRPLAKDAQRHVGAYEYIEGRLLKEKDVTASRVKEAVRFFLDINKRRRTAAARRLGPASEACFSIKAHLELVDGRVKRLRKISGTTPIHRAAARFVREELKPVWEDTVAHVCASAAAQKLSLVAVLPQDRRCLSPSDFGFHNAILTRNGRLRFIDFEYAGWDDVAKTVCDFALQPRLRFPPKLLPRFSRPLLKHFGHAKEDLARARLLFPVFALKWCCIILNDFQRPAGKKRLERQLKKAKEYLKIAQGEYGVR